MLKLSAIVQVPVGVLKEHNAAVMCIMYSKIVKTSKFTDMRGIKNQYFCQWL